MRIPLLLLSLLTSSVAQINYPPQSGQFGVDFRPSLNSSDAWESIVVKKVYGEVYYQTLKKDIPWMELYDAINNENSERAQKMLIEARAVACELPESFVKLNWGKFTKEASIKGEVKKKSNKDSGEHIAWDLLYQSLERKDFVYAEKLVQFLRNNYSLEALEVMQRKEKGLSLPPVNVWNDLSAVRESGDFEEVKRVWKRGIWESTDGVLEASYIPDEMPWSILGLSLEHKKIAYAKMFLLECYDKARLPPNHYDHAKKFWAKLPEVGNEDNKVELNPLRSLARYVAWGLLVESLNHKEFVFAQELSQWLRDYYSKEVSQVEGSAFSDEIAAVKKSKDIEEVKKLWSKIQVTKANGDKHLGVTLKEIPWVMLDICIAIEEVEYAKLMVKEAFTVESTPKDYADAKKLWNKFLQEYNKEEFDLEIPPSGPEQYIGWRLFSESLDREDYEYAQKVYMWLDKNYCRQLMGDYPAIK